MFSFEKRDDGLAVMKDERVVAHVDCATTVMKFDKNEEKNVYSRSVWLREKWRVHFSGYKFSMAEMDEFAKALAAQQE